MQRVSSITSASPSYKAIDNTATRKQFRGSSTVGMLLAVIPLASALIFVGSAAPPAEAHARCDRRSHTHGSLLGVWERWEVKNVVSIGGGLKQVFWHYKFPPKDTWYDGGSVTCSG